MLFTAYIGRKGTPQEGRACVFLRQHVSHTIGVLVVGQQHGNGALAVEEERAKAISAVRDVASQLVESFHSARNIKTYDRQGLNFARWASQRGHALRRIVKASA